MVAISSVVFIILVGLRSILFAAESYETAFNEGNVLIRKQMYQEALGAYENAIRLKPDAFESWYNKALCLIT